MLCSSASRAIALNLIAAFLVVGFCQPARAQEPRWVLVQTIDIEPGRETERAIAFADDIARSRALRLTPRQGAITLTRLAITYGNGQQHIEDRRITLDAADGKPTRDINRTTEALVPASLLLTVLPSTMRATLEVWSLQAPSLPAVRRPADISDVGKPKFHEVLVHFATNRARLKDRTFKKDQREITLATFGGDVGDALAWGEAVVTIPTSRDKGTIPRPMKDFYVFSFQYRKEDPARDFTIAAVDVMDGAAFAASMARVTNQATSFPGHALVFVHGYNVSFDESLFRLAQLAHDMQFDGPVAAYSWPSRGATLDYRHDIDAARISRSGLTEMLQRIASVPGITRVSLIAHSMGSDPTLEALARLRDIAAAGGKIPDIKLNEVIFAAPDVSRHLFNESAVRLAGTVAAGVTLYASANDIVLQVSKKVAGGFVRAGDVPLEGPPLVAGVDSIDISKVSTSSFAANHSEFGDRQPLIEDLRRLLTKREPPAARGYLAAGAASGRYWRYDKK